MDFISTTQKDMEKERSQLLTRCAIAEERIQLLEKELQNKQDVTLLNPSF